MKYIKFTEVDSVTGVCVTDAPARNGPALPNVAGLEFAWARVSAYPTTAPEYFGTAPDDADLSAPGILGEYSVTDWETMRSDEMARRDPATKARDKRNALLSACDWTQVADAPVDQAAWAAYRQALRDVPEQTGFPDTINWPTEPQ